VSKLPQHEARGEQPAPDQMKLTARQAARLSKVSGVAVEQIKGHTIADLANKLRWHVDPNLFLFRQICGQVVKTDPGTGIDLPVPFATVNVYDTDCDFLGYFPLDLPWAWFFPLFCEREFLGSTIADECGKFCVWIPRFDIDWILRWRLEWDCDPIFWIKPSIWDILRHLELIPVPYPGPPDPGPIRIGELMKENGRPLQKIIELLGPERGTQLQVALRNAAVT